MSQPPRNVAVGVFEDASQAQQAIAELRRLGFRDDQLGVISRADVVQAEVAVDGDMDAIEGGVAAGAVAGLGLGFLWALAIVTSAVPGMVIGGGLLLTLVAGAGAGAAIGTVVGALVGLGIPATEAEWYEGEIHAGQVLVTVRSPDRYNEAFAVLHRYGAYDAASGRPAAVGTTAD